ncbi:MULTISPECIES: DMT family transporter [unclassified Rathayibacter]|uniref:DMT family transporter n=1 Tax=unclassified Rathayibacter TaxID=2609250 RepID=UPI00188C4C16|nr:MULTISPECIES: DMT family transporter [unclassified Rathayibacter]MBF4461477.1 DMT family transporter [Rathayibacter sp. VKM Ac-2879]MBF4502888.1 DMT family transporter [Rathayibacter sp. VKM Ac-2878]
MTASLAALPTTRDRFLLWTALVVTVVLWASAFVAIRAMGGDFGPGALTFGRIVVGAASLSVVRVAFRRRRQAMPARAGLPRGRLLVLVIAWGVAWFGVYTLALSAAERHVDAGTAALLVNIAPMITAVLAGLLLGEGFPRRLLAGMLVALVGVAVIAFSTSTGQFDVIGVVLGLLAAVVYGSAATLQKRLLAHVDAPTMTWLGAVATAVVCLPFAPELLSELAAAPVSSALALVYLGIFPTAIAFTTWGYVLARSSAGRTAASTYAVPAVVVLLSWLLLGETPPMAALVGGALALAGVAVATLRRRP